jgi:hypothetical protein
LSHPSFTFFSLKKSFFFERKHALIAAIPINVWPFLSAKNFKLFIAMNVVQSLGKCQTLSGSKDLLLHFNSYEQWRFKESLSFIHLN